MVQIQIEDGQYIAIINGTRLVLKEPQVKKLKKWLQDTGRLLPCTLSSEEVKRHIGQIRKISGDEGEEGTPPSPR